MRISMPTMPTENEMTIIAKEWFKRLDGLKFSDWNDNLKNVSYPFKNIDVNYALIEPLLEDLYNDKKKAAVEALGKVIDAFIGEYKDGYFLKLETRSPKDELFDETNFGKPRPLFTGIEGAHAIINSMRCFEDLCLLKYLKSFVIAVRPYINFHPKNEWRCFIKDGELVGISQYYYEERFDDLCSDGIAEFVKETIIPNVKPTSFIADVVTENGMWLLELNPWGFSDPCLFYDYNSFDGSIKTVK